MDSPKHNSEHTNQGVTDHEDCLSPRKADLIHRRITGYGGNAERRRRRLGLLDEDGKSSECEPDTP